MFQQKETTRHPLNIHNSVGNVLWFVLHPLKIQPRSSTTWAWLAAHRIEELKHSFSSFPFKIPLLPSLQNQQVPLVHPFDSQNLTTNQTGKIKKKNINIKHLNNFSG